MDTARDPQTLMLRYQAGDFTAVGPLVGCVSPALYRFFLAQSVTRTDAEDLLQETWLRIHRVRHTYRPGEPVLPWFYAIARRVRIDHYRKAYRSTARESPLDEVSSAAADLPAEEADAGELEALLAPLPEGQREILRMMKVTGMSLEEVARATASSVGSVKQKVHRAYKTLREGMDKLRTATGKNRVLP